MLRTIYIVSIDAFKDNKTYAFSSSVNTYEDYSSADCKLNNVINEWKSIAKHCTPGKEKEFIDTYGWNNIYVSIHEIIPSGESTHLKKVLILSSEDIYLLEGEIGMNIGFSMNSRTAYYLRRDGCFDLIGSWATMKDFEFLESRPWNDYAKYIKSITILGVNHIGARCFEGCPNLTTVNIQGGCLSIGDRAFENCPVLHDVLIDSLAVNIGNRAFYNCPLLGNDFYALKH